MLKELLEVNDFLNMGNIEAAAYVMKGVESRSNSRKETDRAWDVLAIMQGTGGIPTSMEELENAMWRDNE